MKTKKNCLLDTKWGTNNIFVTSKHYFSLRNYINKDKKSLIYLVITDAKDKFRINTHITVTPKYWDNAKKRLKDSENFEEINLILDNIESRLTTIRTQYVLQRRHLSAKQMLKQFQSETPDFDFISFYRHHLKFQKYKPQTIKNHNTVINKLVKFQSEIAFHEITLEFFKRYRKFYEDKNSEISYQSDLKCIKTFLKLAHDEGINLNINLNQLKVKVESNNLTYLLPHEVKKLIAYYFNEFINPSHILPLGYFLFSCYTGLRISDIKQRTREEILGDIFQFQQQKTGNFQSMRLNNDARAIINHQPDLFEKWIVEQKINAHLKKIAEVCKIDKNITMHVGRHTFATTFYRNTKDIKRLQKLLGHANIRHTMHYVHLVDSEALDDLDSVTF